MLDHGFFLSSGLEMRSAVSHALTHACNLSVSTRKALGQPWISIGDIFDGSQHEGGRALRTCAGGRCSKPGARHISFQRYLDSKALQHELPLPLKIKMCECTGESMVDTSSHGKNLEASRCAGVDTRLNDHSKDAPELKAMRDHRSPSFTEQSRSPSLCRWPPMTA